MLFRVIVIMVHFCCVPGCANQLNRETGLLYFKLLLKRKSIMDPRNWKKKFADK